MKRLVICAFVSFILVLPSLFGQTNAPARDQLQQLVAQLQQSPGDQALREKIIALALLGLRDKTVFLAARGEQYLPMLVFFAFLLAPHFRKLPLPASSRAGLDSGAIAQRDRPWYFDTNPSRPLRRAWRNRSGPISP